MPSKEEEDVLSRADSKCISNDGGGEHGTPTFRVTSPDGLEVDGGGDQGRSMSWTMNCELLSLIISENFIVVAYVWDQINKGLVKVFEKGLTSWKHAQSLEDPNGQTNDAFGSARQHAYHITRSRHNTSEQPETVRHPLTTFKGRHSGPVWDSTFGNCPRPG